MIKITIQFFGDRGASGNGKAAGGGGGGASAVVYKEINTAAEADKLFASEYSNWSKSINNSEYECVSIYTGSGYIYINSVLRENDWYSKMSADEIKSAQSRSKAVSSALSKFTLSENIVVYRGVNLNAFGFSSEDILSESVTKGMKNLVGTTFIDKGFMSTSPVSTSAFNSKDAKLVINVPKGKGRGAWVKPMSQFKSENEFLLQKGSALKITKATLIGGQWEIQADLVGSDT